MDWTTERLHRLIAELTQRQGDAAEVEVKSAAGGCPTLGPTLCAFGNMPEGGTIVLGLDESAGFTPVGLTDIARLEQAVAGQARNSVTPPVRCTFTTFKVAGKAVLVATVDALPLQQRPARHGGQAYLRQSDGDYVMSEQEVSQLELMKTQALLPTHPDRQPVPDTTAADLDPEIVGSFLASARRASRRYAVASDNDILRYTGVVSRTGQLTLAGVYAMGVAPQTASPSLSITAAVQLPSGSTARTRDLVHMVGPVPDLLDEAMAWVTRNTSTSMGYDDRGHGVDRTEIPMRAVREIVANALVHRNLDAITDSKRVEIRLLQDRLVITSPGGLWGVSESQLGRPGVKSAVNPVLYDICKLVRMADGSRVIEGEGGGIRESLDALRSAGLRAPRFTDSGVQFTVVISRHTLMGDDDLAWLREVAPDRDLTSEQRAALVSMRHGEEWTNSRFRREFAPTDSVAARRQLQQLVDTGIVVMHGERKNATYQISDDYREWDPEEIRLVVDPDGGQASIVDALHGASHPTPLTGEEASTRRQTGGRNGDAVLDALDKDRQIGDLVSMTRLTEGQVRYALKQLIGAGLVSMQGAQGVRRTSYRRLGSPGPGLPSGRHSGDSLTVAPGADPETRVAGASHDTHHDPGAAG